MGQHRGLNSFYSVPISDLHTLYGWGADGIVETFAESEYALTYLNGPLTPTLVTYEQAIGYLCDPTGNVASHIYADPTNLDYAFYDAFRLLTGYVSAATTLPSGNLWYKGQSGAETQGSGGDPNDPSNPYNPAFPFPGWLLMGYRWYNPAIGRFWTRDPQGYDGGINLYAFLCAIFEDVKNTACVPQGVCRIIGGVRPTGASVDRTAL